MKQSKHNNLHSTRYRSPYQSTHMTSYDRNNPQVSPRWKQHQQKQFYSANELQKILSQNRLSSNSQGVEQVSHNLECVCPGVSQYQNDLHIFSISQRNNYLEKKIESMKDIWRKQEERLNRMKNYAKSHVKCEVNCYKDKYFELIRNIEPM